MASKYCLTAYLYVIFVFAGFSQQISTNSSIPLQQLIEENLVDGCVMISNVQSQVNGSVVGLNSYGHFERATSNFPFENGIALTSGSLSSAGNTVNTNSLNEGDSNWGTDPDLETALGISNTLNATTIEFDFVSIANSIEFNYILASEEYDATYPCEYSDGFAFLIRESSSSGPYTNIALIPGTSTPVNTTTIHEEIVGHCPAENAQYFDGYNLGDTNYNGRTVVLTASYNIQPNVSYHIKLIIADQSDSNFDSAVFIEGNSFDASVDLGPDLTTCAASLTLNGQIDNNQGTYVWYQDGTVISGENNPTLDVTASGSYTVEITIPISDTSCVISDTVEITLDSEQAIGSIPNLEVCDDTYQDGVEDFDVSIQDASIIALLPPSNYNISYHYTLNDAQNNINPIASTISSSGETIYVAIVDVDNGCLAYGDFDLVVNPLPEPIQPNPLEACNDVYSGGFIELDLAAQNNVVTGGDSNLNVSYHYTLEDAQDGANPISSTYITSQNSDEVFIRAEDPTTGCANTTSIIINITDGPQINFDSQQIDACDDSSDSASEFDLTSVIDNVLQGLTAVSVTFHETEPDAQTGENPIPEDQIENFQSTVSDLQVIYIRVVDDITGCASVAPIELIQSALSSHTNIRDFHQCENPPNSGTAYFYLNSVENTIVNGLENTDVTFYLTEDDRANATNAINTSIPFEVTNTPNLPNSSPMPIYIVIENEDCSLDAEINLIISPPVIIPDVSDQDYCDDNDDGYASVDLHSFNSLFDNGYTDNVVSYHLTQENATNFTNALGATFTNVLPTTTLYVRVTNSLALCYDTTSFSLNVLPAPTVNSASEMLFCDDDQDGFYPIDLTSKIPEIVSVTTNLNITFHTSQIDAETNSDPISTPNAYNANTQVIYTRVAYADTGCAAIVPIDIIVNTQPVFVDITDFEHCEVYDEGIIEQPQFYLIQKDDEILNGQTGKQVLYFETMNDAINRNNAIDKIVPYVPTSDPQTIYTRVENITDQFCFGTSSFTLSIGNIPIFNPPLDWFVCNDTNDDEFNTFDLQEKINEISAGSPENLNIQFYLSLPEAQTQVNAIPLSYTNIENPQQIYVRVNNETQCYAIAEFGLNVVQIPEVNDAYDIEACDTDQDGINVNFDLSISEEVILGIRQEDLIVSYFTSEDDMNNSVNQIPNPENYNNITNPQTIYISATDPVSGCYTTSSLVLTVNLPPVLNQANDIEICTGDDNAFNLDDLYTDLLGNQENINLTFHQSLIDAVNSTNQINPEVFITTNQTVYVRAENNDTSCFSTEDFNLIAFPVPDVHPLDNLGTCDDDNDEIAEFNLTTQSAIVLGSQNPNNFTVSYHTSQDNADNNINAINNPDMYNAINNETIYVRVENNTTGCYNTTSFNTIVHRLPIVDIPDHVICINEMEFVNVDAYTSFEQDTYLWSTGETASNININTPGTYTVTVTTQSGCSVTGSFNVIESQPAVIEFINTVDFADPNSVTVQVSGSGYYLYVLNDGEPQTTNFFYNVPIGDHTITVIDANGCSSVSKDFIIFDIPKFVTPNNDGYFDTWHITGVEHLPGTVVHIFDRYGKLLKKLLHTSNGWDGTYHGNNMPTSDYWYVAQIVKDGREFELKGHFTLKR